MNVSKRGKGKQKERKVRRASAPEDWPFQSHENLPWNLVEGMALLGFKGQTLLYLVRVRLLKNFT